MSAFDFLTTACRAWLGSAAAPVAAAAGVEREELESLAFVHGLEPLLHHLIERGAVDAGSVAAATRRRWEAAFFQNLVFNGEALAVAERLAARLAAAGVGAAFFKGPATLARGYRHPALRLMVDLDLLCREDDLGAVVRAARDEDFVAAEASAVHHLSLTRHEPPLGLEPHFALYDFLPRRAELLRHLLDGVVPLELDGHRFPALAPAPALVVDLAHLVNHDLRVSLRHWLDLAARARFDAPPLDPRRVAGEARRFDLAPELELAAAVVRRLFGVHLPVSGAAANAAEAEDEAARVEAALRRGAEGWPLLTGTRLRVGVAAKLGHARALLFPPRRRLAAIAESGGGGRRGRARHLAQLARRIARLWRGQGLATGADGARSIKRRVYERRRDAADR